MPASGACTGCDDGDETNESESDDSVELVQRRVDSRDRFGLRIAQGQMSRHSFEESDADDIQL